MLHCFQTAQRKRIPSSLVRINVDKSGFRIDDVVFHVTVAARENGCRMIVNQHHSALPVPLPEPANESESPESLEWGDAGRDPRFPPGWFVVPAFLFPPVLLIALLIYAAA